MALCVVFCLKIEYFERSHTNMQAADVIVTSYTIMYQKSVPSIKEQNLNPLKMQSYYNADQSWQGTH